MKTSEVRAAVEQGNVYKYISNKVKESYGAKAK
jgi:hypothetical protein